MRHQASCCVKFLEPLTGRAASVDTRTMTTIQACPNWCTEYHDPAVEAMTGDADHAAAFLHEPGGALVALHRLDPDGQTHVWVDPGPQGRHTPEQARRLAMAILAAVQTAE